MENEHRPHENKIEILPKGDYFETDEEGFLVNPASIEKIQPEWRPAVDDVVEAFKQKYGPKLKNVHLRGSVSKGKADQDISDLDTFAFVDLTQDEIDDQWPSEEVIFSLSQRYPFIKGFELAVDALSDAEQKVLKLNQSVCIYGEPLEVKRLKIDKELVALFHWENYEKELNDARNDTTNFLQQDATEKDIQDKCVWVMKKILRTGAEVTTERSGKYTRDLYSCYQIFSEYYPEKAAEMYEVLDYALNPTADPQKILKIIDGLGTWLTDLINN